jgi:hypothetical protein
MLAMPLRAQCHTQESQCARDLRVVSTTRSSSPVGNSPNVGKASDTASCGGKVTRSQAASARRSPMRPQATPPRAGRQNTRSRAASATQLPHPAGEAKRTGREKHHRTLITTAAVSGCSANWLTLWHRPVWSPSARVVRREFIGQRHSRIDLSRRIAFQSPFGPSRYQARPEHGEAATLHRGQFDHRIQVAGSQTRLSKKWAATDIGKCGGELLTLPSNSDLVCEFRRASMRQLDVVSVLST